MNEIISKCAKLYGKLLKILKDFELNEELRAQLSAARAFFENKLRQIGKGAIADEFLKETK